MPFYVKRSPVSHPRPLAVLGEASHKIPYHITPPMPIPASRTQGRCRARVPLGIALHVAVGVQGVPPPRPRLPGRSAEQPSMGGADSGWTMATRSLHPLLASTIPASGDGPGHTGSKRLRDGHALQGPERSSKGVTTILDPDTRWPTPKRLRARREAGVPLGGRTAGTSDMLITSTVAAGMVVLRVRHSGVTHPPPLGHFFEMCLFRQGLCRHSGIAPPVFHGTPVLRYYIPTGVSGVKFHGFSGYLNRSFRSFRSRPILSVWKA